MNVQSLISEISIPSTRKVFHHTEYQVIIITNHSAFHSNYITVYKRYSDILKLHRKIERYFPYLPDFPEKTWFRRLDLKTIENRRANFEKYLSYIVNFILQNNLENNSFAINILDFFNK